MTASADEIARELTGGQVQTYAQFVDRMASETATASPDGLHKGTFLGKTVEGGVSPPLRKVLQAAEDSLSPQQQQVLSPLLLSVRGIRTRQSKTGNLEPDGNSHGWGYAIDINYALCPYLIGERGEDSLNSELRLVYNRIAQLMLGLPTATISALPASLTGPPDAIRAFWRTLKAESDALKWYFSLLDRAEDIPLLIATVRANNPTFLVPDAYKFYVQLYTDYLTLTEQPYIVVTNPATGQLERESRTRRPTGKRPNGTSVDRPFTHTDPRDGFLDAMPEDLVVALTSAGLDWGACALGKESGDIMHFQHVRGTSFKIQVDAARQKLAAATPPPATVLGPPVEALHDLLTERQEALRTNLAALATSIPGAGESLDTLAALLEATREAGQAPADAVAETLALLRAVRPM